VNALQPMDILCVPRNKVPPEGTLPRCEHSHYRHGDPPNAFHCYACNPVRPGDQAANFVLPRSSSTPLNGHNRIKANGNEAGMCPNCFSRIHSEENKRQWRCEEFSTIYPAPGRSINHQFRELIAAEHAEMCMPVRSL
jgi:hypothetical protein